MGKQFEREYIRICFLKSLKLDAEIFALKTNYFKKFHSHKLSNAEEGSHSCKSFCVCVCVFSEKLKFGIYF